tara:strand:- start:828 stop:1196 length:369 start_codon:yes stop_codon:yes gene_type:complete
MKRTFKLIKDLATPLAVSSVLLTPLLVQAQLNFKWNSFIWPGTINDLLTAILTTLIVIATPIVVFFIIYAGFLYVTARGNTNQVQQATRALTYAIIGGVFIIGAVAIAQVLNNIVGSFTASP